MPLWAYTPVRLGGLGWSPPFIASIISFAGLFQAFWLLILMPILDKRLGTRTLTRLCFGAWPLFFAAPILVNRLARGGHLTAVYAVMLGAQFTGAGVSMAFSKEWLPTSQMLKKGHCVLGMLVLIRGCTTGQLLPTATVQLLLNRFSPPEALGTLNGLALALNALLRTGGPAFITSAFAFGINHRVLGGYFACAFSKPTWVMYLLRQEEEGWKKCRLTPFLYAGFVLMALGLIGLATTLLLPAAPARERTKTTEAEEAQ